MKILCKNQIKALDDIRISKGDCPKPGDCNFEDGSLCNYENTLTSDIKWIVTRKPSNSPETGPTFDHTFGNSQGAYAVMNTENFIPSGWKGQLQSQIFDETLGSTVICIRFWYFMFSSIPQNLGALNVYTFDKKTLTSNYVWSLSFSQGKEWREGKFTYKLENKHHIIFEGIKGQGRGDIALDDISFSYSNCGFGPDAAQIPVTSTSTTTSASTTPDTSIQELDCDFETVNCQWFNSPNNTNTNWTIYKSTENQNSYAPIFDHTLGSNQGSYLSLNSYSYFSKTNVLFSSPLMNGTKCVAFWFGHNYITYRFLFNVFIVFYFKV